METTFAFDVSSLQWNDGPVQVVLRSHLRSWGTRLYRRGRDKDDITQEMAVVFLRTKEEFTGEPTLHRFLAFLTANMGRRLIDLDRNNRYCGRNLERLASSFGDDDSTDILAMVPSRRNEEQPMIELEQQPEEVQAFINELRQSGLQTSDDGGNFLPLAQFCMRATGRPWNVVRPLVQRWARKCLSPA